MTDHLRLVSSQTPRDKWYADYEAEWDEVTIDSVRITFTKDGELHTIEDDCITPEEVEEIVFDAIREIIVNKIGEMPEATAEEQARAAKFAAMRARMK